MQKSCMKGKTTELPQVMQWNVAVVHQSFLNVIISSLFLSASEKHLYCQSGV